MRVLGLALELRNFHVAGSLTKHCVGDLTELFHVLFEGFLTYVPGDVAHEKRGVVGRIRGLFRFFKLFLGLNRWRLHHFFFFLFCLFLFFKLDRLRTDYFLLSLVGILKNVLNLSFVGSLR